MTPNEFLGAFLIVIGLGSLTLSAIVICSSLFAFLVVPAIDHALCWMASAANRWVERQGFLFRHEDEAIILPYSAQVASAEGQS